MKFASLIALVLAGVVLYPDLTVAKDAAPKEKVVTAAANPKVREIRRIVTGHDAKGRSVFASDGPSPHVTTLPGIAGMGITEIWKTLSTPADTAATSDGITTVQPDPPKGGTIFRIVEFPPDGTWRDKVDVKKAVAPIGEEGAKALATGDAARHPMMHKTQSLDYAIVLSGEIWAVLDEGERKMSAGDVLVQMATSHAWANHGTQPSVVAFVLIDARP